MAFPITIGGRTFTREMFRQFAYADEDTGLLAAFEAILAHVAAAFHGVSTSTITPSVAQKTLTVLDTNGQIATTFRPGDYVRVSQQGAETTNWMTGPVDSFDDETGSMVLSVEFAEGSTEASSWYVTLSGPPGPASGADANAAFIINGSNGGLPNALTLGGSRGIAFTFSGGAATAAANAPTEVISATTHTIDADDRAGQLHYTHASGCAVTVPAGTGSYVYGFPVVLVAEGGALTLTPAAGTIESASSYTVPAGKAVRIVSTGSSDWKVLPLGYTTIAKAKADLNYGTAASQAIAALTELGFAAGVSLTAASTTNIGAAASPFVTITGDTGINAFDAPSSPVVRWIRFTGNPLIDNNSALVLGDQDIQITAGDTMMLRFASGVWYLVQHRRADGTPTQRGFGWEQFTSSGTWNKSSMPAWAKGVLVIVDGAGGSGGAGRTSDSQRGGGGAGGGRAIKYIARASLGTTETVTVGGTTAGVTAGASPAAGNTGATSSFGSHCSATGGTGGPAANGSVQAGVAGGTGVGGDLNYTGGDSPLSFPDGASSGGGRGGNSAGGGQGGATNVGAAGTVPGGGGAAGNHTVSAVSGTGARGEVIVYYV